jgi:mRNA interferase YafQ
MYELALGQSARKALKRYKHSGSFPRRSYEEIIDLLLRDVQLPPRCEDHALQGDLSEFRECHINFTLLVRYKRSDMLNILTIENIGTHPELFGE